jgi:lipoate---protein ligase
MIQYKEYDLPDFNIYKKGESTFYIWQPDKNYIVLGTSNRPEDALIISNILKDNITVYKRPTGGQAVVLTPKTLVVSVLQKESNIRAPKVLFEKINSIIIQSLEQIGVQHLSNKGISDIAIREKKILGSALYRNKERNFYHAVLNISESADIFERYLKHPVKEPDYRKGRTHKDFVISLEQEGYSFMIEEIKNILISTFEKTLNVKHYSRS